MAGKARHKHDRAPEAEARRVKWPDDLETVRQHFRDYREWLADHRDPDATAEPRVAAGLALVDRLIAELPGAYGPPRGDILLWFKDDSLVAIGAMREIEPKVGEIKRVYVRPDYRGPGFGKPFVRALIGRAREIGYEKLRSDTLPSMQAAIEFYQELGFRPVPAFWPNPVAGALFFERDLMEEPAGSRE